MAKPKIPMTASFVSQKGGVGKSALARLLAIGAIHRGRRTLLADFDLDQLTCVEWGALRMRASLEPEVDARAFKSLKRLRKDEGVVDFIVADTRGLADDLSTEIAEDSDVVFLPTGVSQDDLRPTLSLARKLARRGAEGRLVVVLSKVGRSETQFGRAVETIEEAGFELLERALAATRRLPERSRRRPRRPRGAQPLLARDRRADGRGALVAHDEGEAAGMTRGKAARTFVGGAIISKG